MTTTVSFLGSGLESRQCTATTRN